MISHLQVFTRNFKCSLVITIVIYHQHSQSAFKRILRLKCHWNDKRLYLIELVIGAILIFMTGNWALLLPWDRQRLSGRRGGLPDVQWCQRNHSYRQRNLRHSSVLRWWPIGNFPDLTSPQSSPFSLNLLFFLAWHLFGFLATISMGAKNWSGSSLAPISNANYFWLLATLNWNLICWRFSESTLT